MLACKYATRVYDIKKPLLHSDMYVLSPSKYILLVCSVNMPACTDY